LTCTVLLLAVLVGYARHALFNSDQFANRATAALRDPSVRTLVAERITDGLVLRAEPDVLAVRPLIESVTAGIIGSSAVTNLFHAAAKDVHRAVFSHDENTATLTLRDVGTVVGAALVKLTPQVAAKLESRHQDVEVVKRRIGSATGDLARVADDARLLAVLLAVLTVLLAAAAIYVAPDRRRAVGNLGTGAAVVGGVILVGYAIARSAITGSVAGSEQRDAARAVWDAFLGDLRTVGWIVAVCGVLLSATAASLLRPRSFDESLRRAWAAVAREPERTWLRVLRGVAFVALGLYIVLQPATALRIAGILVGLYLLQKGISALLQIVYRPELAVEMRRERAKRRARAREGLVWAVAVAGIAAIVVAFTGSGAASEPAPRITTCEGHRQLCDRPFNDIALAATHNSMAAPLPGWFAAEQESSIGGQLNAGIRGLLIDTHYADKLPSGKVRTYFGSKNDVRRQAAEDGVGTDAVDAALRIRARLGFRGQGTRGLYLCHTFCEIGATPLSDGLGDIRNFLVTHPADVVVVINQDYVTPADFVKAIKDAGLDRYAYSGPVGKKWPTLRQMISDDQRLVLLAENHAGAAPWYRLAYSGITQETPFHFPSARALTDPKTLKDTCRPNRGTAGAPLFLINHWVSTDPLPRPSDASKVNAYGPLLDRARACEKLRHRVPNLVAINFYRRGDVFRVVDALNGFGQGGSGHRN
jgi:hypothetical protein